MTPTAAVMVPMTITGVLHRKDGDPARQPPGWPTWSQAELAELFTVARSTVYRTIQRASVN